MRSKREEARVPWVRPRLLQAVLLLLLLLLLCVIVCSVFEAEFACKKLFVFSSVTFSLKSAKLKNSLILSLRSRAQIGVTDKRRDDAPPPPRESFE